MNERSRNDQLVIPPERDEMFPALAPGIDPEDIAPLWLLQSKLPVLEAFMTLFRGSMTDSLVRLWSLVRWDGVARPPNGPLQSCGRPLRI